MMKENEKKLRYFEIGGDNSANKTKIVPCGQFGITEVEVETKNKVQSTKPIQNIERKAINLNKTMFGIASNFVQVPCEDSSLGFALVYKKK